MKAKVGNISDFNNIDAAIGATRHIEACPEPVEGPVLNASKKKRGMKKTLRYTRHAGYSGRAG